MRLPRPAALALALLLLHGARSHGAEPESTSCPGALAARDAVVLLRSAGSFRGSGFVFGDGRTVATARHVIDDDGVRIAVDRAGGLHRLRLVAVDRRLDLAILELDAPIEGVTPLRAGAPDIGRRVVVIGHPGGNDDHERLYPGLMRWSVVSGTIINLTPDWVLTDAMPAGGASGGPILGCDGTVLGVTVAIPAKTWFLMGAAVGPLSRLNATRVDALGDPARPPARPIVEPAIVWSSGDQIGAELAVAWLPGRWWGVRAAVATSTSVLLGDLARHGRVGRFDVPLELVLRWRHPIGDSTALDLGLGAGWSRIWTDDVTGAGSVAESVTDHLVPHTALRLYAGPLYVGLALTVQDEPRLELWTRLGLRFPL